MSSGNRDGIGISAKGGMVGSCESNRKPYLKRVYVVIEGDDYIVRVEASNTDSCLCVCNGQLEADLLAAMVKAVAWNTSSQEALAQARKAFTKFME